MSPTPFLFQFYINDHLNTPQRLVDENSAVTWEADYEAFGEATVTTEAVVNNHRFPGQYFDAESGLYYNWNRYYDPATGRYVTSDPIGLGGGMNTFGYVGGNPLRYTDPRGEAIAAAGLCFVPGAGWVACGAAAATAVTVGVCYVVYQGTKNIITAVCGDDGSQCNVSLKPDRNQGDVGHDYVRYMARNVNKDYCEALKEIRNKK